MKKKPLKLIYGDKIGVFLPSSSIKNEFRRKGLNEIREMGFIPVEAGDIFANNRYFAACPGGAKDPVETVKDLRAFFTDEDIKAVWAARGGYGSNHLLKYMKNFGEVFPKILIGSSDVSYLLWYFQDKMDMVVFYGPMAYSSIAEKRFDRENLNMILSGSYEKIEVNGKVLKNGVVKSPVTGGCLSNIVSLIGTEYFPVLKQKILLLEDINERPYRLDRMIWQMSECGSFSGITGLILGEFPGCFKNRDEKTDFFNKISKYFYKFDFPVLYDLPFGHSDNIMTLPLGIDIEIDTERFAGITIKEKGVL